MPPFSTQFEALGSITRAVAGVALLCFAASGIGWLVVTSPARAARARVARLVRFTVGLCLVGWLGVTLGSLGLLTGSRSLWLLGGLALGNLLPWWRGARASARAPRRAASRGIGWVKYAALTLLVTTLGPALSYPTGWDELVYHHELPRRWHADGWPAVYADLVYSGFPSLGEILFWLVAPLDGAIAPRLLTWTCWLASLALAYHLLRRRLAAPPAGALTLAFAVSSAMLLVSANCYVEPILTLSLAAILVLLADRRLAGSAWSRAIALGILAGGAAGVKLTGLAVLVAALVWHASQAWQPSRKVAFVPGALLPLAIAVLVAAPFYLRPWLITGNPVYPYFDQWFSANPARVEMSRYHHELGAAFGLRGPAAFVQAPVFLAFLEEPFDGTLGWQLLLMLWLAALAGRFAFHPTKRWLVIGPALTSAWLYVFWFFTAQQARFALPAALALLALSALGLRRLRGRARTTVVLLLVGVSLWSAPWRTTGHYVGSWLAALGMISRTEYVNESTDRLYLPLIRALGEQTPTDAHVLLLFEHRGYYLPRAYLIGTPFFQAATFTPPEAFADPRKIMDTLAEQRITHVVVPKSPAGPDVLAGWIDRTDPFFAAFAQCVQRGQLVPIWQSERYALLEVSAGAANPAAP